MHCAYIEQGYEEEQGVCEVSQVANQLQAGDSLFSMGTTVRIVYTTHCEQAPLGTLSTTAVELIDKNAPVNCASWVPVPI